MIPLPSKEEMEKKMLDDRISFVGGVDLSPGADSPGTYIIRHSPDGKIKEILTEEEFNKLWLNR